MIEVCRSVREELPLFEEGSLDAARMGEVRAHLAGCAACKQEARLSAESWKIFKEANAPAPLPKALQGGRFDAADGASWFPVPGWALGLAAAAFLLGLGIGRRAPAPAAPAPAAARRAPAPAPFQRHAPEFGGAPQELDERIIAGKAGLAAAPFWKGEGSPVLSAKPVVRKGPALLPLLPLLGSGGSGLRASPSFEGTDPGLLVTPPTGSTLVLTGKEEWT